MPDERSAYQFLLGPLAGAFLGYWLRGTEVRRSETIRSETISRLDDVAKEVASVQAACQQYWSKSRSKESSAEEYLRLEAEVLGRLHLANILLTYLEHDIGQSRYTSLDASLRQLRQDATGGNFKAQEREADPARMQAVFTSGGKFTGELRSAGRRFLRGFLSDPLIKRRTSALSAARRMWNRSKAYLRKLVNGRTAGSGSGDEDWL